LCKCFLKTLKFEDIASASLSHLMTLCVGGHQIFLSFALQSEGKESKFLKISASYFLNNP